MGAGVGAVFSNLVEKMTVVRVLWFLTALLLALAALHYIARLASGAERFEARVVRVIDGDTLVAAGTIGLFDGLSFEREVRLRGIDAPELSGDCPAEITRAIEAKNALKKLAGDKVILTDMGRDKFGRLLARVLTIRGRDIGAILIKEGLARKYDGVGPRQGWCG